MANIKVKYFVKRTRKDGSTRHYWSPGKVLRTKGWKLTPLSHNYAEALSQAQKLNYEVDTWRKDQSQRPPQEVPGTVNDLINKYKKSPRFTELRDRTKKDYTIYLDKISVLFGDVQAQNITPKIVDRLYEKQAEKSKTTASYLVRVLRLLFTFGEREEIIPLNSNPARRMNIKKSSKKAELWKREDIKNFARVADAHGYQAIGTAIIVNEWLGQRPTEMRELKTDQFKNGKLRIKQQKTGAEIELPIEAVAEINARIQFQIEHNTHKNENCLYIISQDDGTPYTEDWFSKSVKKIRDLVLEDTPEQDKARVERLVFRSLRHTAVTRLAQCDCTIPEIAAITGHSLKTCQDIIDIYLIRTSEAAENAFQKRQKKEIEIDTTH